MTTNQKQMESPTEANPLLNFGLTIPFEYYIPEPQLENEDMDEDTLRKEYEALSLALQKVFQEKEEFHHQFQIEFGLAVTTEEIVWHQLNEMHPPLPKSIAKREMKGAVPTNILEQCYIDGVK